MSVYDDNREAWEAVAARGGRALAEMAKHFDHFDAMGEALGYRRGSVQHWIKGRNFAPYTVRRAEDWLREKSQPSQPTQSGDVFLVSVPAAPVGGRGGW